MDDNDWLLISELYKTKNLTQTAEKLYVTQPTITKKIKKIEQEFNITIYNRKSSGVSFTPQGEYLAEQSIKIAQELDFIKKNVKNMRANMVGTLNIGVSNHFAKYDLPEILSGFKNKYPYVEFNIHSGYGKEVFNTLNAKNIHIGLLRSDYEWSGIKIKLNKDPICLVSTYPLSMHTLPDLPRIEYKTGSTTSSMIENWWESNFDEPPLIGMTVDNVEGCKETIVNGLGYGILPESILNEDDSLYKKYLIETDGSTLAVDSWMYYTESLLENKIISEFVDYIKNKYKGVTK